MFELGSKELTQAQQFIREGKFEDSLQLLSDFEERKNNSLQDIVSCHLIKCILFFNQGLLKKVVKFTEQTYKESLGLEKNILSVDSLIFLAHAHILLFNLKLADKIIKQGEELLKTITEVSVINKNRREAFILYLKGMMADPYFSSTGDVNLALKLYKHGLALGESVDDKVRISSSLIRIAWGIGMNIGDLDLALDYVDRALTLSKDNDYKLIIIWALHVKATIYHNRGEVTRSISLYKQSLAMSKELNHEGFISGTLNNMADAYRMKGELDQALECSEQSLEILSKFGELMFVANSHDYLIQVLIEKGDLEQAREKFNQLEQLNNQLKDKYTNEFYLYNKALLLKESSRISNRGKAEEILKQILEEEDVFWEINQKALLLLCELLLLELQMTGDLEVLVEVESYITRLLDFAEKSHSYWIWGETFLLQAKLALTSLNLKEARRLLTQGQKIAEKYGLNLLAKKISNEHDELLTKLKIWESIDKSETPIAERMKLSRLNEQMGNMIRRHAIEDLEFSEEEPMLLLIVTEGGTPIFSQSFVEAQVFEDHLFGGFLSAINTFMDEMFSEGLDRVIFGEHTLVMNSISPFFMCYIFKGQSYQAQRRVRYFIDKIQRNKDVWETFNKFHQMNKEIQLADIPALQPLITEIFIDKTII
ncbi:MAG: tetratricopeptide repeat protein [Promethearchaeota archaeon]|jgi:tetratricopeptide (TPR) repeat protein